MSQFVMFSQSRNGLSSVRDRLHLQPCSYIMYLHPLLTLIVFSQGGLTIVDIYSDWAGPCTAMAGALKKIKLEVGDDSLMYAMARYVELVSLPIKLMMITLIVKQS